MKKETELSAKMPTYQEFMNPTLEALRARGGSARIEEIAEEVIGALQLPDEITEQLHTEDGRQTERW